MGMKHGQDSGLPTLYWECASHQCQGYLMLEEVL